MLPATVSMLVTKNLKRLLSCATILSIVSNKLMNPQKKCQIEVNSQKIIFNFLTKRKKNKNSFILLILNLTVR